MSFLGYNKGETLEFNYKKACGLWLTQSIRDCTRDGCRWRTNHQYAGLQYWLYGEFLFHQSE